MRPFSLTLKADCYRRIAVVDFVWDEERELARSRHSFGGEGFMI
jgi:hypothetical protein